MRTRILFRAALEAILGGTLIGLLALLVLLLATDPEEPAQPVSPCSEATRLADALVSQHERVLDHVRAARAARTHEEAVFQSVAGQNALDAYGWTVEAYEREMAACR